MRGAWILTSTWEAIRLAVALAGSVVLGSFANPVSAQTVPLTLKLSRRLADSAVVPQGKAVRRTIATAAVPGLRLVLSQDLTVADNADKSPASGGRPRCRKRRHAAAARKQTEPQRNACA